MKQIDGYSAQEILYEKFVDEQGAEIRRRLKRPEMSREEMLTALVGMPWPAFQELRRDAEQHPAFASGH